MVVRILHLGWPCCKQSLTFFVSISILCSQDFLDELFWGPSGWFHHLFESDMVNRQEPKPSGKVVLVPEDLVSYSLLTLLGKRCPMNECGSNEHQSLENCWPPNFLTSWDNNAWATRDGGAGLQTKLLHCIFLLSCDQSTNSRSACLVYIPVFWENWPSTELE